MSLSNMITSTLFGVMALSGALARRELTQSAATCAKFPQLPSCSDEAHVPAPGPDVSSAICTAVAWGYTEATNEDQSATAAANAHAYICGTGSAEAHVIAQATARAFARAVADASVSGYVSGDASCWASAEADAVAKADVWLTAYAEAFASSADCEHCETWAEAWAYIRQHVFLEAVASAKASLDLYVSDGGNIAAHVHSYAEDIEEAIATAYAEALAGTATYYDTNACWAWVGVEGCIVSEENPEGACASCQADAVAYTFIEEIDTIAEAVAKASADACGDVVLSYASASAWAKAIAKATAIATSSAYASCQSDEGGYACADAGSFATDTASAVAKAFAHAWTGAIACDTCHVNKDAASESIGEVLVTAASSAYAAVCADEGHHWTEQDFEEHIVSEHLVAIAEACAFALSLNVGSGGLCLAAVSADTYVGPHSTG